MEQEYVPIYKLLENDSYQEFVYILLVVGLNQINDSLINVYDASAIVLHDCHSMYSIDESNELSFGLEASYEVKETRKLSSGNNQ